MLGRVTARTGLESAVLLGKRLDGPRALTQEVEQLEPFGGRDGFPDAGELHQFDHLAHVTIEVHRCTDQSRGR